MQEPLENLTERVAQAAAALGQRYGARRLHTLRVSIRRMRTFLKQRDDLGARRMRKAWGGYAAVTNDARDWDVFHKTARGLLPPRDYRSFRRLNRRRLRASHQEVKTLVDSPQWDRHLRQWHRYLERWSGRPAAATRGQPSLEKVLGKAGTALSLALQSDDDRAWHKFRIAVKETRYIAEAASARPAPLRQVIATCKSLQATLGEWHDTVIQLQLLGELAPDPVHARLRSLILARKTRALSQTRALLAAQSIFVPAPDAGGGFTQPGR